MSVKFNQVRFFFGVFYPIPGRQCRPRTWTGVCPGFSVDDHDICSLLKCYTRFRGIQYAPKYNSKQIIQQFENQIPTSNGSTFKQ
jgi:hypothetical protein